MIVDAYHLCGTEELEDMEPEAQQRMIKTRVAHWLEDYNFLYGTLQGVSNSLCALLPCAYSPAS
jgi:hypothetical protein